VPPGREIAELSFGAVLEPAALAVGIYMALGWLLSVRLRDVSLVDVMWGPGFALVAGVGLWVGQGFPGRQLLVLLLVGLWGARLAVHIFLRNRGKGEDYRYRAMRERQGPRFVWLSAFTVFGLQGALLLFIALPLVAATALPAPALTLFDLVGTALFALGFLCEAVADAQLVRFKADPANRGKVCDIGLWRFSRHPNYFGDATLWWGLFLIACAVPGGWRRIGSPIVMTVLLLKVSGVALLERGLAATKPGYADYVLRTSAFVPWFPRRLKSSR
jgi:steroid 5-alpha reductase family enzyme